MQQFLKNSVNASRLSVFNFFMAPMQAAGLMLSSPKFFFTSLSCALGIIISLFVYVGGIIVIPGIISLMTAMTLSVIHNKAPELSKNLFEANFHYRIKIYCYNALALLPLVAIIAAGTNLYYSFNDGKLTSPNAFYIVLATLFFCLTFGLVITAAVTLAMRNNSGILVSCADAIELLWKNPAGIFALWVNWFLEIFFFYFLVVSAMLVIRMLGTSWSPVIASGVSLIVTALLAMVFIAHYLVTTSLLTIELYSKVPSDTDTNSDAEAEAYMDSNTRANTDVDTTENVNAETDHK